MSTIFFLILFPFVVALALLVLKTDAARDIIVKVASIVIAAASVYLTVQYFGSGVRTHSISMRYKSGTVRFVDAIHSYDRKPFPIKA